MICPSIVALALTLVVHADPETDAIPGAPVSMSPEAGEGETPSPAPAPAPVTKPKQKQKRKQEPPVDPYLVDPGARASPASGAPPKRPRGRKMMITGWSLLGGGYLVSAFVGALIHDGGDRTTANLMFVPLVGPIAAAFRGRSASLPYVALGVAQITGLALGTAGTVLFVRARKTQTRISAAGIHIGRGVHVGARPTEWFAGGALTMTLGF